MTWKEAGYPSNAYRFMKRVCIITSFDAESLQTMVLSLVNEDDPLIQYTIYSYPIMDQMIASPNFQWLTAILVDNKIILIK
jgi:hypothetical protein